MSQPRSEIPDLEYRRCLVEVVKPPRRVFKLVIIGDVGVGKTTFLNRHLSGRAGVYEQVGDIPDLKIVPDLKVYPLDFKINLGEFQFNCWDKNNMSDEYLFSNAVGAFIYPMYGHGDLASCLKPSIFALLSATLLSKVLFMLLLSMRPRFYQQSPTVTLRIPSSISGSLQPCWPELFLVFEFLEDSLYLELIRYNR